MLKSSIGYVVAVVAIGIAIWQAGATHKVQSAPPPPPNISIGLQVNHKTHAVSMFNLSDFSVVVASPDGHRVTVKSHQGCMVK